MNGRPWIAPREGNGGASANVPLTPGAAIRLMLLALGGGTAFRSFGAFSDAPPVLRLRDQIITSMGRCTSTEAFPHILTHESFCWGVCSILDGTVHAPGAPPRGIAQIEHVSGAQLEHMCCGCELQASLCREGHTSRREACALECRHNAMPLHATRLPLTFFQHRNNMLEIYARPVVDGSCMLTKKGRKAT